LLECSAMSWVTPFVDWLNRYANLLLVIITAAYAYLTWKTLKVLERSNLREREAQHLEDIKTQVVSPILQWLDLSVMEKLKGQGGLADAVVIMGSPRSESWPRQLYPANLQIDGFSPDLYEHAKSEHFGQLRKYQAFREMLAQFLGTLADFANKCCADIQPLTSLPPFAGDRSKNIVDCEGVVQACLRGIIGGSGAQFYIAAEHTGSTIVTSPYSSGEVIARGPDAEIQQWLDKSKKLIEKSWNDAHLRGTVQRMLDDAEKLRDTIRQIELTYALPKYCKYVRD
jgi:hypothetical protein